VQDGGFKRAAFPRYIPVPEVRSAIHIRTGQRAVVEALDAWLARHQVEIVPFDDVYDACVHLLRQFERIPDLALVGTDWLADDELSIVSCIRQTWPRTAIVVYGTSRDTPRLGLTPLIAACSGPTAIEKLLAQTPAELVRRMCDELAPLAVAPPAAATAEIEKTAAGTEQREGPSRAGERADRPRLDGESSRAALTPQELSALLDPSDDR